LHLFFPLHHLNGCPKHVAQSEHCWTWLHFILSMSSLQTLRKVYMYVCNTPPPLVASRNVEELKTRITGMSNAPIIQFFCGVAFSQLYRTTGSSTWKVVHTIQSVSETPCSPQ
jgi:hypothetical protein